MLEILILVFLYTILKNIIIPYIENKISQVIAAKKKAEKEKKEIDASCERANWIEDKKINIEDQLGLLAAWGHKCSDHQNRCIPPNNKTVGEEELLNLQSCKGHIFS